MNEEDKRYNTECDKNGIRLYTERNARIQINKMDCRIAKDFVYCFVFFNYYNKYIIWH